VLARPNLVVTPSPFNPRAVEVSASGLPPGRPGEISECSSAGPQPTVVVSGVATPVSCTRPRRVHVGIDGTFASVRFRVVEGRVGPPAFATDSWGHPAATDAQLYPCRPTTVQVSVGAFCYLQLRWGTGAGHQTVEPLTFPDVARKNATTPTTTATTEPAQSPRVPATMTVTPDTDLAINQVVVVRATGLPYYGVGLIRECNSTVPQPTIAVDGVPTPVSCSNPGSRRWTFGSRGRFGTFFQTIFGTVGPPRAGTDSSGHSAAIDARQYPCSPTAAQVATGAHCYLELVWGAGATSRLVAPITFAVATSAAVTATTTTTVPTTTTSDAPKPSGTVDTKPKASSGGLLPFTGAEIERMALVGLLLVIVGAGLLLVGVPWRRARRHSADTGAPVDTA
jgi:hypothetical protein